MLRCAVLTLVVCCVTGLTACGGGSSSSSLPSPPPPPAPPDFSLQVQPAQLAAVLGASNQVQVTEAALNGFTGTVSINTSSLPSGITISPTLPQNIGPSGLSLSFNLSSSAIAGTYNISLTGTSGSLQHSTNLALTLKRANVSITGPSQTVNIAQGATTSVPVNINTANGIVDFTIQVQAFAPSGVTATLSSSVPSPNTAVTLTLAAASSASAGPARVTVQATRSVDGVQVSSTFPIYVDPKPGTIAGNRTNWVRLGSNPIAVFYDSPRNHVFASLPAMNRVVMIDPSTGNILSSIPVSVANNEPNGLWLASSSNLSGNLDGKSLMVLGAGHVATIDLASGQIIGQVALPSAIPIGWTTPSGISPTFLVSAAGGHIIFGSWGNSSFYNWDGISALASLHTMSDLYSFDRNLDGSKVLVASGDTSGAYQLLDVASDTIAARGAYSNATIMTVRGNPVRNEWAVANSNGVDFLDSNLNLVARVQAAFIGSHTYWGMTYSSDGKFLCFVYSPDGEHPFLITVDDTSHQVVRIAPATGTDLTASRAPPDWIVQPFAADSTGMVFGLGEKGLVIDDSTYAIDPSQSTFADYAIIATPDNGPLSASTLVQITTQSYTAQPDVWFGTQRALSESLSSAGQVSATAAPGQVVGPVNIKLFPPDGYAHVMPQAFTYGTTITSVRHSTCPANGGCSADVFGFGLFGPNASQTSATIGGNAASVQSTHYFNAQPYPYPYPLQYLTVTVPPGLPGPADVVVQSGSGQATLSGGFLYAQSLQSYPSPQTYNALLFDEGRGVLYASTDTQIVRFSPSSSTFLTPITPPSITGQNQFQAMSLTPDGSKLIVANKKDVSVAIIDPDNATNAQAIAIPAVSSNPGGPVFVAATSTSKVLISIGGFSYPWTGPLYQLDLATSQVQALNIPGTIPGDGMGLYPIANGNTVFLRTYGGFVGFWDPVTGQFSGARDNFAGAGLGAAAGDGNMFAVGLGFLGPDGSSMIGLGIPDQFGGFQGIFPNQAALNDSGSLEFVANNNDLFIFDTHHGDLLQSIFLPNQVNVWTRTIALDSTANHVFVSDSQGLTVLTLAAPPLAVGSVTPSSASVSGGTILRLRGSGFSPSTTVDIGGQTATTLFVDANTIQVTAPAMAARPAQIILHDPDGEVYQLDDAVVYQ